MASRCLDEFNPWPSFVDIFSSVILVLLLFLLVLIVNIGYYAQFKFKVQYEGSISTDQVVLTDESAEVKVDVVPEEENKEEDSVVKVQNMEKVTTKAMQQFIVATDLESAGEDLADKEQEEQKASQKLVQEDKVFYIEFSTNKIHIQDEHLKKLKIFMANSYKENPKAKIELSTVDPSEQLSMTIAKQISIGRVVSTRIILKKYGYKSKNISFKLGIKPKLPEKLEPEYGLVIVRIKG